jgi:hypothetical protein
MPEHASTCEFAIVSVCVLVFVCCVCFVVSASCA